MTQLIKINTNAQTAAATVTKTTAPMTIAGEEARGSVHRCTDGIGFGRYTMSQLERRAEGAGGSTAPGCCGRRSNVCLKVTCAMMLAGYAPHRPLTRDMLMSVHGPGASGKAAATAVFYPPQFDLLLDTGAFYRPIQPPSSPRAARRYRTAFLTQGRYAISVAPPISSLATDWAG